MGITSIREILNGRTFAWTAPDATLETASDLMAAEGVTALPVLVNREAVGIVSERDILRYASQRGGFVTAPVAQAMTREVVCVETRASIAHALMRMQEGGFGQLPVLDLGGKVVGMLTRADIPENYRGLHVRHPVRINAAATVTATGAIDIHA